MTDERLLVVDLAATSKNWALTPEGERQLRSEAPEGWRIHVVRSPTSSDGDGPPRPSDEVMTAVRDAEIYYGFGIPRLLFLETRKLKWVHSAAAGVEANAVETRAIEPTRLAFAAGRGLVRAAVACDLNYRRETESRAFATLTSLWRRAQCGTRV